jgi:hypothetical protein
VTVLLALVLSAAMLLVAAVHAYWGVGSVWPGSDERSLARMVVGSKGIVRMPSSLACFAVAAILLGAAVLPLMAVGFLPAPWPATIKTLGLAGCGLLLVGRGVMSFVPAFRRLGPEEPFATMDRRLYGPLCLALGAAFFILLLR